MAPRDSEPAGRLARLGRLAYRRRGRFLAAWVATLVVVIAGVPAIAGEFDADYSTPGSESARAATLLAASFPGSSGDTVDVVWQAPAGARSPEVSRRVEAFIARAERLEGIGEAAPPRVSPDGTIAIVPLALDRREWDVPVETGEELIALAERASGDGLRIELGGAAIRAAEEAGAPEAIGLVLAAVILLIAFGSVVAAGLPLAVALFGLGISATLIGVLAAMMDVPDWAPAVAGLIGIGVGIDYALLVLTRYRSALAHGSEPLDAVGEATATAGRSVLVAGATVVISMLGLFFVGVSYLRGVALSASLAVLIVMAASLTLLPALLGFAGRRVDRLRIPGLRAALHAGEGSPAHRWSRLVQRRAPLAALAGTAILLALAVPVTGLRLGFPDASNDPPELTTRAAYDLAAEGFGRGANGPLLLAVEGADGAPLDRLAERLRGEPGVAFVGEPVVAPGGRAALLQVVPESSPQDARTEALVRRLRERAIPAAVAGSGLEVHVGGVTAGFIDQSDQLADRLPVFVAGVLSLSFLLLLAAFRSPLIALKAVVMNLLSIGAAYGVISVAAEGGAFGELLGVAAETPVAPFIPIMMFAILFGLSMDYEVFLLSRVREEYLVHGDTSRAVAAGLGKTARVITAAAAIIIAVFLAFLASNEVFLKLLGIGMATAILVDATIVRMVLVPAVMQMLGRANWWLPRWLDRALPDIDFEPPEGAPRAAPAVAEARP